MSIRTTETTVTFNHAFQIANEEGPFPAGTYRVVADDEEIAGVSFLSYRRVATMLLTPSIDSPQHRRATLTINQTELDAALMRDKDQTL